MTLSQTSVRPVPPKLLLIAAFAAIYLIWGSTYLAIRVGVESWPPFLMGGIRFLVAGSVLGIILRVRGIAWPSPIQWRNGAITGTIMLVGGNGLVNWAEQRVPSSTAALFIASAPVWFAVFEWLRPGGSQPGGWVWLGVFVGLAGVALLVFGNHRAGAVGPLDPIGAATLGLATICWAGGSTLARHTERPTSPWMTAAVQMSVAGLVMLLVATGRGELRGFEGSTVSGRSWAALAFLIVFGSWIAFSAYVWLLTVSTPARVSTYAYVNPVVAVLLGWIGLGEVITPRMGVAAAVILTAVIILTWPRARTP